MTPPGANELKKSFNKMDEENFAHNGDPLTQNWGMVDGSRPWYRVM